VQSIMVKLLLFLYLTSAYLGATHIHHKALKPLDCKVHILVKNLNSADIPIIDNILLKCEECYNRLFHYYNSWIQPTLKGFNAQAPPFFFSN